MAESSQQHWETYWSEGSKPIEPNRKIVQVLMSLGDPSSWKVLEVGAGRGADSVHLAKRGADCFVLDFSKAALATSESLAKKEGVTLKFVEADALEIPFEDDSFDVIFHQGFLEHFREPQDILREQHRVLRRGGFILIDVPQKYTLYTIRKQVAIKRGTWFAGWETQYGPRNLEKQVRRAGFDIVGRYGWGMTGSYGWGIRNFLHRLKSAASRGGSARSADQGRSVEGDEPGRHFTPWPLLYLADNVGVVGRKK